MTDIQVTSNQIMSQDPEKKLLRQFSPSGSKNRWFQVVIPAVVMVLIIAGGVATGYFLANRGGSSGKYSSVGETKTKRGQVEEAGVKDEESFPDRAEGRVEVNQGEVREGSHRLVRPGGESQTAYLTSSVVDLDQFVDQCVEVWGETFAAQQAGWLMDIGYVKRLDKCPEGI